MPHEWHRDAFTLSTDHARLDLDMIHGYLAASYWAMQPPNWEKALEHMRIARDMGYQPAVEALPKLERARNQAPLNG